MVSQQLLSLHVGEQTSVTLPGLGTAGYQWFAAVDDPDVAQVERAGTVPRAAPGGAIGSRDEVFSVTGLRVGETVIHFTQSRAFEPGKPPLTATDVTVRVN